MGFTIDTVHSDGCVEEQLNHFAFHELTSFRVDKSHFAGYQNHGVANVSDGPAVALCFQFVN
jgi:hypothetical protein